MGLLASVIIINYNYGCFLGEAIQSALKQDLGADNFETIIVDDGSTDDSAERARPYLDRVRWVSKARGGQVSAFNAGFAQAKGQYIALLESDDTWEPSKLRRCVERLEDGSGPALVQHWLVQTDAHGRPLPGFEYPNVPDHFELQQTLYGTIPFAGTSCIVFRASSLRPYLPLPEELLYGADICLRLIAATLKPIANIPEILGSRRIHGRNLFGKTLYDHPDKLARALAFHEAMIRYQKSLLTRKGIAVDPSYFKQLQIERIRMELFLRRYRRDFAGALLAGAELARCSGLRSYTVFKSLTLFIALLSPAAYLRLHEFYSRNRIAKSLRRTLFPA